MLLREGCCYRPSLLELFLDEEYPVGDRLGLVWWFKSLLSVSSVTPW